MAVAEANYGLAQDYFRLKAKLLELPRLALYDQYAPVGKEVRTFPYAQAQQVILKAFDAFDPRFRQIAAEFFAKNWIDAEIRKGKRGGAFCASPSPQLHPYILCNYDDNLRDVMTVAHELGHGLHGCLKPQAKLFQLRHAAHHRRDRFGVRRNAGLRLLARASNRSGSADRAARRQDRRHLRHRIPSKRADPIRRTGVLRQEQEKRLTPDALGKLWLEANGKYYGDAVDMPDGYRWGWSYIPHFIHSRFYCYSYVFGQLLVLALYRMYKDQGKSFVPKYIALLEAGGSDTPEALLKPLGVDIHQRRVLAEGV